MLNVPRTRSASRPRKFLGLQPSALWQQSFRSWDCPCDKERTFVLGFRWYRTCRGGSAEELLAGAIGDMQLKHAVLQLLVESFHLCDESFLFFACKAFDAAAPARCGPVYLDLRQP